MYFPFESTSLFGKSTLDTAMKLNTYTVSLTERLIKLQVDFVNELVNESSESFQASSNKPGNASLLEYWQNLYQANLEKSVELGRRYTAELSKAQSEIAQLVGELTSTFNKDAFKNLEEFTKTAIEESEKAARVVEHPSKSKRVA